MFHFCVAVTVVQRLTAWVAGVPVLKLVTQKSEGLGSSGQNNEPSSTNKCPISKKWKQSANSLEDEDLNKKLRDGRRVKRNPQQEEELAQLQKGTCLF